MATTDSEADVIADITEGSAWATRQLQTLVATARLDIEDESNAGLPRTIEALDRLDKNETTLIALFAVVGIAKIALDREARRDH